MIPAVSIIMPCYNAAAHLATSVGSVLTQTFSDWELIAVDDGSGDGTLAWLQAQTDDRIRPFTQLNQGVSAARNTGLANARGHYVAFLDADDTWNSTFLEKMLTALSLNPDALLAYCGWQNVGLPGGRGDPFVPPDYEGPHKTEAMLEGCRWPIHGALTRRSAVNAAGNFDTGLTIAEDYLLWLEVSIAGTLIRVPEVLVQYHHHGGVQATRNLALAAIHTLEAKQIFLRRHPEVTRELGSGKIELLTWEKLIQQGNTLHWKGDVENARPIFRKALLRGHGSFSAKLRMLPSLLPLWLHRAILTTHDRLKSS